MSNSRLKKSIGAGVLTTTLMYYLEYLGGNEAGPRQFFKARCKHKDYKGKDWYEVLEVSPDATIKEINKAYILLKRKYDLIGSRKYRKDADRSRLTCLSYAHELGKAVRTDYKPSMVPLVFGPMVALVTNEFLKEREFNEMRMRRLVGSYQPVPIGGYPFYEATEGRRLGYREPFKITAVSTPKDQNCSICLELLDSSQGGAVQVDSCKHQFHKECIERWGNSSRSCPECRAAFFGKKRKVKKTVRKRKQTSKKQKVIGRNVTANTIKLRKQAKKLKIRLTVKRNGKRVYKSDKMLKQQIGRRQKSI